ncbi:hypothetical protein FK85_24185 [Halorubrum saccharovorum]|uniref:DUF7847 domain-containing protein n=1 Tax=Halorubrum saccharovorum TaxID=2248 RepID=A0A0F8CM53_9EURY|nr:hypothetical protein [Halorubrum saccharovorum]KKF39987.1 hypothetical protein FK85_24185 [Halorubrum saccharovorum]
MAALQALRPAAGGVARNPILIAITALYGLVQLPNLLIQPTQPLLASVISLIMTGLLLLVLPFFQGGMLAMGSEAIRGKTSLSTLVAEGKANYISLLLAYFVLFAINLVFGFIAFFGLLIAVLGTSFSGVSGPDGLSASAAGAGGVPGGLTLLAVVGIVAVGLVLVYLLITFLIQFYAHAIVLDDRELVDGFRRSVGLVRSNLLSVLGYSVLLLIGGVLVGALAAAASFVLAPQPPGSPIAELIPFGYSTGVAVVGAIGYVLLTALSGAFYTTYSVAFYEAIRPETTPSGAPDRHP